MGNQNSYMIQTLLCISNAKLSVLCFIVIMAVTSNFRMEKLFCTELSDVVEIAEEEVLLCTCVVNKHCCCCISSHIPSLLIRFLLQKFASQHCHPDERITI